MGTVMKVMAEEIRAEVRFYLHGKIRQWRSRADGKDVIFVSDSKDAATARSVMPPLANGQLVNLEFTSLSPIGLLLNGQLSRRWTTA
jgi:hypothetical protein